MDLLLPDRLRSGARIGLISPSAAVTKASRPQLTRGIRFLRRLGFETELGRNALKRMDESAGTPEQRAEDIHYMFSSEEIDAVICVQGGATANMVLPLIDFDLIAKNPKIFMGMSNITVLLNSIFARTGLVTFHGNDVMFGFGRGRTRYDEQEFVGRLVEGKVGSVNKNSRWMTIRRGSGKGRLMGGNLPSLLSLAGTPFWPDLAGSVLLLEAFASPPDEYRSMLGQLKQAGAFDRLNGVLIGYIWGLQATAKRRRQTQMEDIVHEIAKEYDFPIVKCDDFGHNCPNTTLPVGATVRLEAEEGSEPELQILEPCVK